jgi:hypothetical protein
MLNIWNVTENEQSNNVKNLLIEKFNTCVIYFQ